VEKVRPVRLRFTARAIRQFGSIADYIAKDNPAAALSVGWRVMAACRQLTEFPAMGREGARKRTREFVVSGLPYLIVYRVDAEEIVILGIYHGAQRRPG